MSDREPDLHEREQRQGGERNENDPGLRIQANEAEEDEADEENIRQRVGGVAISDADEEASTGNHLEEQREANSSTGRDRMHETHQDISGSISSQQSLHPNIAPPALMHPAPPFPPNLPLSLNGQPAPPPLYPGAAPNTLSSPNLLAQYPPHQPPFAPLPPSLPHVPPLTPLFTEQQSHVAMAHLHHYEARMRDHAVAYATAAAGAAWAAAQIAAYAASNTPPTVPFSAASSSAAAFSSPQWQAMTQPPPRPYPYYVDPATAVPGLSPHAMQAAYLPQQGTAPDGDYLDEESYYQQNNMNNNNANRKQEDHPRQEPSHQHRRKRQQLRPPPSDSSSPVPRNVTGESSSMTAPTAGSFPARHKVRRRLRSSLECDNNSSSSGSSLRRSSTTSVRMHNKKKARSDESLLGKSAVSALYEWCSKERQRPTPTFRQTTISATSTNSATTKTTPVVLTTTQQHSDSHNDAGNNSSYSNLVGEEFECTVLLEQEEWGRGRGRTKAAAKQEAARRALQALVPGVVFDEATGILIELPPSEPRKSVATLPSVATATGIATRTTTTAGKASFTASHRDKTALEDLAPHLARRLAIGRDEEDDNDDPPPKDSKGDADNKQDSKKRLKSSQQKRAVLSVYSGTSTTDEEDESTYYASRGASVCSALLHAMIQINPRIRDPPALF